MESWPMVIWLVKDFSPAVVLMVNTPPANEVSRTGFAAVILAAISAGTFRFFRKSIVVLVADELEFSFHFERLRSDCSRRGLWERTGWQRWHRRLRQLRRGRAAAHVRRPPARARCAE